MATASVHVVNSWAVSEMHTAVKSVLLRTLVLVF